MTNSFSRVPPLSNAQVDSYAVDVREFYGQSRNTYFDILSCLHSGKILTRAGVKKLVYQVRPDGFLGSDEARMTSGEAVITIEAVQKTDDGARFGEGRSRFTLCHELGHGVLHHGIAMPRSSLALVKPAWIENQRSSERQADRFSGSILAPRSFLRTETSAREIAIDFGLSFFAAEIVYSEMKVSADRIAAAARVRRLAETFQQSDSLKFSSKSFTNLNCPRCGLSKLFPIAGKYMCDNCNIVQDALQDGDTG